MIPTPEEDLGAQTGKVCPLRPLSSQCKDRLRPGLKPEWQHHTPTHSPVPSLAHRGHSPTWVSLLFCSIVPWQRILPSRSPPCQDPQAFCCDIATPVSPKMGQGIPAHPHSPLSCSPTEHPHPRASPSPPASLSAPQNSGDLNLDPVLC